MVTTARDAGEVARTKNLVRSGRNRTLERAEKALGGALRTALATPPQLHADVCVVARASVSGSATTCASPLELAPIADVRAALLAAHPGRVVDHYYLVDTVLSSSVGPLLTTRCARRGMVTISEPVH